VVWLGLILSVLSGDITYLQEEFFLDFAYCSVFQKETCNFGYRICFSSYICQQGGTELGPTERSVLRHLTHCAMHKVQNIVNPVCNMSLPKAFRINILVTSSVLRLCVMLKAAQTGLISFVIQLIKWCILLLLLTAIEMSLSGSGPYTSTEKRNKNKYT
jgi:hypothetical protein